MTSTHEHQDINIEDRVPPDIAGEILKMRTKAQRGLYFTVHACCEYICDYRKTKSSERTSTKPLDKPSAIFNV